LDFSFSKDQEALRNEARDFLKRECPPSLVREMEADSRGFPVKLWENITELGWIGLPFPAKYGGGGRDFLDLVILLEEMGRVCLPLPFMSTVALSGLTILDAGSEKQKGQFIHAISGGKLISTLALMEPNDNYFPAVLTCRALDNGDTYVINGIKLFVTDAHISDYLLVAARIENIYKEDLGIGLFIVDNKTNGLTFDLLKTIGADKQFEVSFNNVTVSKASILGEHRRGSEVIKRLQERAAVAKCAEMLGGAQQVLEMTVNYTKNRKQFDRLIGSFQVIQHNCVNMAIDIEASRLNTYHAAWKLSEQLPASQEVAVAKAWVSEAYHRIISLSHQIMGAIAFTKASDLELYIRRAKAAEVSFGDSDFYRDIIIEEMHL
jgi:alkylation response protein AidB-like acyl-CoA dehydrogenase